MARATWWLAGLLAACRTVAPVAPAPPEPWPEVFEGLRLGQDHLEAVDSVLGVEATVTACPPDRRSRGDGSACVCVRQQDAWLLLVSSVSSGVLTGAVLSRGGDPGCVVTAGAKPLAVGGVTLEATRMELRRWDFHLPRHGPLTSTRSRTMRVAGEAGLQTVMLVKRVDVDAAGRLVSLSAYLVEPY